MRETVWLLRMTAQGHEDQFPLRRRNARCVIGRGTSLERTETGAAVQCARSG
jgi:hypothetical protein